MSRYRDFDWFKINTLLTGQVLIFARARAVVAGYPYFGFSRNKGIANSCNYKALAWVAIELLRKIDPRLFRIKQLFWLWSMNMRKLVKTHQLMHCNQMIIKVSDSRYSSLLVPLLKLCSLKNISTIDDTTKMCR